MSTEPLYIVMFEPDTALVASEEAPTVPNAVTVSLAPGDSFRDIPYEAWDARRGEVLNVPEFAAEYAEHGVRLPPPEPPPPPAAVACPRCATEMLPGSIQVDLHLLRMPFLAPGALPFLDGAGPKTTGLADLTFAPDPASDDERPRASVVLKDGYAKPAFQCPDCRSVYIP